METGFLTDGQVMAGMENIRHLISQHKVITVMLYGEPREVEYLEIPAVTWEGKAKPPIFIYPGGGTHLGPCFEMAIYLDRRIIVISPPGYGWSSYVFWNIYLRHPLHGAEAALQVLRALGETEVEIIVHSNAGPIGQQMVLLSERYGVKVTRITFVNPLGLRHLPILLVALAFPLSGALTRILSWGHDHPYKHLADAYQLPPSGGAGFKNRIRNIGNGLCRMWYELSKSSKARLPGMLREMKRRNMNVPVTVIQSNWDWASLHLPGTPSNEKVFKHILPDYLLTFIRMQGLHNVTLGKDSKYLARAMHKALVAGSSVIFMLLPQLPVLVDWLGRGFVQMAFV